jgi:hypothetical protein
MTGVEQREQRRKSYMEQVGQVGKSLNTNKIVAVNRIVMLELVN